MFVGFFYVLGSPSESYCIPSKLAVHLTVSVPLDGILRKARHDMALTNIQIRNAKPQGAPYKLSDEKGMYLLVTSSGGNYGEWITASRDCAKLWQ